MWLHYLCKDCGFQGDPFILNTEKDYQNFLKGLKKKKRRE